MPSGPLLMLEICGLSVLFLHETLLVPVLMYGAVRQCYGRRKRFRIRAMQIDNLRGWKGSQMYE